MATAREHQGSSEKTMKAYRQSQHSRGHPLSKGKQVKIAAASEAHLGSRSKFPNLQFGQIQFKECHPSQCLSRLTLLLSQPIQTSKNSAILSNSNGKAQQATSNLHREHLTPSRPTLTSAFLPRTVSKTHQSISRRTDSLIHRRSRHSSRASKRKFT